MKIGIIGSGFVGALAHVLAMRGWERYALFLISPVLKKGVGV
jgi:predicted dehydrogenase